ncbi:oxidoreductase-like protein [Cladochytrium replicatum]|nr:oxidoreductase-like protein [Cladochytrium replicatum]
MTFPAKLKVIRPNFFSRTLPVIPISQCVRYSSDTSVPIIDRYAGYWNLILQQENLAPQNSPIQPSSIAQPSTAAEEVNIREIDELGLAVPSPPTDCCMSGCVHCIWDIYQEDMDNYRKERDRRKRSSGVTSGADYGSNDGLPDRGVAIDPGMKAFLELERKLKEE